MFFILIFYLNLKVLGVIAVQFIYLDLLIDLTFLTGRIGTH